MKDSVVLTISSLLLILFLTFHLTDDIIRGWEPGTGRSLIAVPICAVWLYGTLVLGRRRSGNIIMLLGSLLSLAVPILHIMIGRGVGVGSRIANSSGAFFFIWTLIAIGAIGLLSVALSARGLWNLRRGGRNSPS